jgi:nucleoside-diphosphate-sugar epimerase
MSVMNQGINTGTMLITGANGFIGSRLSIVALANGYIVKTLSRSTQAVASEIPLQRRYTGHLPDQIPPDALYNVDVVVHCAALMKGGRNMAKAVNVEGTLRLAEMAIKAKVRTFIFLSSQSAKADAISNYGWSKYAAELALRAHFLNSSMNIIIIRPGLVTGHGQQGLYGSLCRAIVTWPVLPLIGGGRQIVQPIHVDDLCHAIFSCDRMAAELNGSILNLGHSEGATLAQFLQYVAQARLGHRKVTFPIPIRPVYLMVRAVERLGLTVPVTSENLNGLTRVDKMDTESDMALIGLPARPLDIIVRDDMNYDQAMLREADFMTRYLLGVCCSHELKIRYAQAIERLKIELDLEERRLWRIVNRYPFLLRIIDGGSALLKRHGGIRRKIYTMLAILEASPEHADLFLPKAYTGLYLLGLVGAGIRAGVSAAAGVLLIKMINLAWR